MQTIAANCNVAAASNFKEDLARLTAGYDPAQIFVLTDRGSFKHCARALDGIEAIRPRNIMTIEQGDTAKNIATATQVWQFLSSHGATRKALLVNLGGGMPCDLGGFCASTFKRGISFINIPTTLLAQVDASIGGKTGINLDGLKNEIGTFRKADAVLIDSTFLTTLDKENLLSGYAEMLKHALIHDAKALDTLMAFDMEHPDFAALQQLVADSIAIKNHFVTNDPEEHNIRKALNFGHTFGHAFETAAMHHGRPMLHGRAVAYGMVCELYLSTRLCALDAAEAERIARYIIGLYGPMSIRPNEVGELIELMRHDKKNTSDAIVFTLLPETGRIEINRTAAAAEITEALDYLTNLSNSHKQ